MKASNGLPRRLLLPVMQLLQGDLEAVLTILIGVMTALLAVNLAHSHSTPLAAAGDG